MERIQHLKKVTLMVSVLALTGGALMMSGCVHRRARVHHRRHHYYSETQQTNQNATQTAAKPAAKTAKAANVEKEKQAMEAAKQKTAPKA